MSEIKHVGDFLLQNYERALLSHGDTARGADWPNEADRRTRFEVMLDVIVGGSNSPVVLCDLGCGTGELLAHIRERGLHNIIYIGIDRSAVALSYARAKYPDATFIEIDVNSPGADLDQIACDFLVANGLFTVKWELNNDQMCSFLASTISRVWPIVRRGIAFNVMSKVVDWERDDLFHLPMDDAARLLHGLAGRRVRLRADYGLYEYTAYAYKAEVATQAVPVGHPRRPRSEETEAITQTVPVLQPRLPRSELVLAYLCRIDATRIYTNHGPLMLELERRLLDHLQLPAGGVACASSGTTALIGAILGSAGRAKTERPWAVVPAYTFAATAAAVEQCGYRPYLADIDANSWLLDCEATIHHPLRDQLGLVVPVATFGSPVPQAPWQTFVEKAGIPVVIDGAASFAGVAENADAFLGAIPVALSFHATKCFATGEGGAVVSTDADFVARATQALNFGFYGSRDSRTASTNGKMSEYHAAVGLAELDGWEEKLKTFRATADKYRRLMADVGLADRLVCMPDVAPNYVLLHCQSMGESESVQSSLRQSRIDFRLWYGGGLHHQTYFAYVPRGSLEVTESLAPRVLGLPVAPDLTEETIGRVIAAVAEGILNVS